MAEIGMERKTESREFWSVQTIGENHKRKKVANLTGLNLERPGIFIR